jgi:alpha-L-fucosidase
VAEIDLGRTVAVGISDLREEVSRGQLVARYRLEGAADDAWQIFARGTTIGFRKLDRFPPIPVRRVRLVIEDAVATPRPVRIALYAATLGQSSGG